MEREEIGGKHERERKIVVNYTVHVHVVCSSISSFWLPTVIISPAHGRKRLSVLEGERNYSERDDAQAKFTAKTFRVNVLY